MKRNNIIIGLLAIIAVTLPGCKKKRADGEYVSSDPEPMEKTIGWAEATSAQLTGSPMTCFGDAGGWTCQPVNPTALTVSCIGDSCTVTHKPNAQ